MSANTSIQWTDRTWNPVRGCSVISPGCVNCYAMKQAHRFSGEGKPYEGLTKLTKAGPQWTGKIRTVDDALLEPLSWRKPSRVFVNSMSDLFHEDVPDAFILKVMNTIRAGHANGHTFQVLTKRAERMRAFMSRLQFDSHGAGRMFLEDRGLNRQRHPISFAPVMRLMWLGVSVENQQYADERIPLLLQTPAAVRFISAEPLLGPVDVSDYLDPLCECETQETLHSGDQHDESCPAGGGHLEWVIVGGESGPGARPFDLVWARRIVQQCKAAGVPVFVKQLGARPYVDDDLVGFEKYREAVSKSGYEAALRDRKGGDPSEWPDDLRVREFPA